KCRGILFHGPSIRKQAYNKLRYVLFQGLETPAHAIGKGMMRHISLQRGGHPITTSILQEIVRWWCFRPEVTGFGLVVSGLIESAHVACLESERAWRRKVLVDVSQVES